MAWRRPKTPVPLDKIKIIALMVLWSQEAEIDNLVLEELLDDEGVRACTDRGRALPVARRSAYSAHARRFVFALS